jgi:hypothetical protein
VDDWIQIKMAAQTGVMAQELKKQLDTVLQQMIHRADTTDIDQSEMRMIEAISQILTNS